MKRKAMGIIGAALVVGVLGAVWIARPGDGGAAQTPEGLVPSEVVAPGMIEPETDRVELGFDVGGRVDLVTVGEGMRVKQGQLLARLDDRAARARLAAAEAALAAAEARHAKAMEGARSSEIRAAAADAEAARARAWERKVAYERAVSLHAKDAIGQAEVDRARGEAEAAQAQADAATARHTLVKQGVRDEEKREALAAVEAARADVELAATLLSQTELRAPQDGVILQRYVEPGEQVTVTPVTVAFTMADTEALLLRAEIDEGDVGRVAVGQRGFATADAYGERRFEGEIVRIAGELGRKRVRTDDPRARVDTRVLEVLFRFGDDASLPLGLRMDLHLTPADAAAR
jgi:multidrug resistance efflux pump